MPKPIKVKRTRHKLPKRGKTGKRTRRTKQGAGLVYYGEASVIDKHWRGVVAAVGGLGNAKRILDLV